ncbi:MAG: DUF924 domain-containing protein [Pseudomonadales bacterium]|nr:DUF924 domain-containing protein [Pseudomonadales bacterium]
MDYQSVIEFWFNETDEKFWWAKDDEFDNQIRERFGDYHAAAVTGDLFDWRSAPEGRLAEIIVLDQFSRNMFRNMPWAFAWDGMALVLAQEAVNCKADQALDNTKRAFMYLPYMHSESAKIHEQAVTLFNVPGMEDNYQFELKHKEIIDRFGRYPHRNELLGRESTDEEIEFLKQPGSSF